MVFNKDISGINNEIEFVNYLNNKKIFELNPMFYSFIEDLFIDLNNEYVITCWKNTKPQKTDIFICINNTTKNISIKKGIKNSVHVERISDFVHFLIENNIDREIIIEYLKYQYADGTTNGTGKIRLSATEYKKSNQNKIDLINKHFNKKDIIENVVNRFILKGKNSDEEIDAIIYGIVEDFIWIKSKDIKKTIISKKDEYSTGVHFSSLTIQPMDRCLNKNVKYNSKRFCVQVKWYNLCDDIIYNMNNKIVD